MLKEHRIINRVSRRKKINSYSLPATPDDGTSQAQQRRRRRRYLAYRRIYYCTDEYFRLEKIITRGKNTLDICDEPTVRWGYCNVRESADKDGNL